MVTLTTVLKSGGRYDASWVERLNGGARRSIPGLDRVVCLSDIDLDVAGVDVVPLLHGWPAWWSKFEAFRTDLADDLTILCDLDTVFTGDAGALINDSTAAMEDYFLKGRLSTALMRWQGREFDHLYETFKGEPERWMQPGSCGTVPNSVHGDQVVVDHLLRRAGRLPAFIQNLHPDLLDFYDPTHANQGPIIVFIGESKPDTAIQAVQDAWHGTRQMQIT
ncbi:hypothetical protein DFI02_11367 [Rhizobium sp. PP-F2F-G20b]|nr:hypothetical protein DFI02_11367 [Rhizobium sp. PP-F2F-G20b]